MRRWKISLLRAGALLPILVFLLGLTLTAAATAWLYRGISEDAQNEFQRMSARTAAEIETRFLRAIFALQGARGFYAASHGVEREEFRTYVGSLNREIDFPGVRGFGFVQRVLRADVDRFVERERQDAAPDFTVRQLDDKSHDALYVVKFIEPLANNMAEVGLDIGSEPVRRAGAQEATDTGQPTITGSITLRRDGQESPGVLLFVPVYGKDTNATTVPERRAALVGLLYAPIVLADLLDNMHDVTTGFLDFEIYDSPLNAPNGTLMFDADNHVPTQIAAGRSSDAGRNYSSRQMLVLPGRELTLSMNSTRKFDASIAYLAPWLVLVGGALTSAMLTFMLLQQTSGRKKAEARARAMTIDLSRLAEVVKHTSNAVSTADRHGRITWINEGFTAITGYTPEEAIGKTPGELLGSGKADARTLKKLSDAARSGQSCRVEILNQAKGGREYWTDTEIQPQFDAQGDLTGFMEIGIDITEHRHSQVRLEAALRDSDALLGTLNLHAIISTTDALGTITQVNDAFCDISGYTREELIGGNHRIVNSGTHSLEFWEGMWKTISTGMPWRGELCSRAKNGQVYWADTFIAPFIGDDGKIDKYIAIRTDITLSKNAQAEVQSSKQLLIGSIEAVDEAFVLYDPEDRLVLCNQKYREIYQEVAHLMVPGVRFADIIRAGAEQGQYLAAIGRVDEWVAERVAAHQSGDSALVQKLANGRTLRIIERKLPDGHIVGFRVDISELTWANEAAQAASQSKSQFLANMSHEIRTPMNAILGMLTLLRKTALNPKQADYVAKSDGAARALLGLINEILDFSKIEAGKMTLDPHPFDLDQLLRDLSVILSTSAGAKPIEVLFDIDPALPRHLVGDAMRLQQVLLNLGSNAIKFTAEGNVVLSMQMLQSTPDSVTLQISMRDSGIGIAPENHARIFSGFTQAESSTTRRFGGTGLGVAISQRFVTMMGGELALESALGEGSRFYFTVTLPLAEAAPEADQTVAELSVAPMRALMVDDNPIARDILEQMGLSLGWTVDLAETGEQALALLKSQALAGISYQAVFVDWQMPGMDGWQTSHSIHETPLADEMPVIVMVTAHGREMLAQRSQADQDLINGFLVKPVTALMLKEAVLAARVGPLASRVMVDSSQRLTGLRLLLVEDNLNNQQVARELLEAEGATVQVANHGQEGVEAIAAASVAFDVVLMDLQMPVMDGFAATHHIRNVLGLKNLPVVAMTANAMASDREACLAAGMNDHVGKPFDLNDLVRVLCKQAGRTEVSHAAPAPAAALPPIAIEVADRAGVDLVGALRRLGGNHKVYQRMLATFAHDLATMPSQLNTAVQQGDTDSARRLLHTLKGLAASLGATALSSAAAQGEKQMAAKPSAAEMTVLAQSACVAIDAALPGLTHLHQTLLAEAQASDASSQGPQTLVDKPALLNALKVMAAQLKDSDMDAMQSMAELQQQFGSALGERLGALEAAMAELDFDAALPHCNALIESINA